MKKSFCFTTSQSSREAAFSTTTASAPLLLILLLSKNRTRLLSSSEKWLLAANSMLNLSGRRDHWGPRQGSTYNSKKDPSWQPSKRAHQNSYRRRNVGALLTSSGPPFFFEKEWTTLIGSDFYKNEALHFVIKEDILKMHYWAIVQNMDTCTYRWMGVFKCASNIFQAVYSWF